MLLSLFVEEFFADYLPWHRHPVAACGTERYLAGGKRSRLIRGGLLNWWTLASLTAKMTR